MQASSADVNTSFAVGSTVLSVKVGVKYSNTTIKTYKSIVNALPKVVGFLRVLRFPLTGKVDRVG